MQVLCGFTFLPCGWLLTLQAPGLVFLGLFKGSGSGGSPKLQLCSSFCFPLFRPLTGKGDVGGGRVRIFPLRPTWGVGEGGVLMVSVFSPAFLQAPRPCRDRVFDTTSPISVDIGPKLGSMITSHIRSSMDGALESLQSLLQGTGPIPGRLARDPGGLRDRVGACLGKNPMDVDPFGLPATPWDKCHDFGGASMLHFFMGS